MVLEHDKTEMGRSLAARIRGVHDKSPGILLADIGQDDIFQVKPPQMNGKEANLERVLSFMHVWLQHEMGNTPQIEISPYDSTSGVRSAFLEDVRDVSGIYQTMMSRSPLLRIANGKESEPVELYEAIREKLFIDYGGFGKNLRNGRIMSAELKRDLINTGHFLLTIDKMPLARQVLWAILGHDQNWLRMYSQGNPHPLHESDAGVHFDKSTGYPLRMALATLLLRDGVLDVHFNPGESHGYWCLESEVVYKSTSWDNASHSFSPNHKLRGLLYSALAPFERELEHNKNFFSYVGTAKNGRLF